MESSLSGIHGIVPFKSTSPGTLASSYLVPIRKRVDYICFPWRPESEPPDEQQRR